MRTRKTLSRLLYGIFLLACATAGYIYFTDEWLFGMPPFRAVAIASMTGSIALLLQSFVRPRSRRPAPVVSRRSWNLANGIWVLVITAIVGVGIGVSDSGRSGVWGVLLALILGSAAFALARFVKRHGDEIGEARFDTRNPEGRRDDP